MEINSTPQLPWSQPGWFNEVSLWLDAQLSRLGVQATGPYEQFHLHPWSTVLRLPTSGGPLYFKFEEAAY